MTESASGDSSDPRDIGRVMGMEGIAHALDHQGNPVCPHCGAGAFTMAALANSGSHRQCWCPSDDPRVSEVETKADALIRIFDALDCLERIGHNLTCRCDACEAAHVLRTGVLVGAVVR